MREQLDRAKGREGVANKRHWGQLNKAESLSDKTGSHLTEKGGVRCRGEVGPLDHHLVQIVEGEGASRSWGLFSAGLSKAKFGLGGPFNL